MEACSDDLDAWRKVHRRLTLALLRSRDNVAAEFAKRRYLLEETNRCIKAQSKVQSKAQSAAPKASPSAAAGNAKAKKKAASAKVAPPQKAPKASVAPAKAKATKVASKSTSSAPAASSKAGVANAATAKASGDATTTNATLRPQTGASKPGGGPTGATASRAIAMPAATDGGNDGPSDPNHKQSTQGQGPMPRDGIASAIAGGMAGELLQPHPTQHNPLYPGITPQQLSQLYYPAAAPYAMFGNAGGASMGMMATTHHMQQMQQMQLLTPHQMQLMQQLMNRTAANEAENEDLGESDDDDDDGEGNFVEF